MTCSIELQAKLTGHSFNFAVEGRVLTRDVRDFVRQPLVRTLARWTCRVSAHFIIIICS